MTKKVSYYQSEDVLGNFYKAIAAGDNITLSRVHIPRSDVFYVRSAIEQNTGVRYSLDRIERSMFLEGKLKAADCFEPERVRVWEKKYNH
jgi:hypothetical protein